MPTPAAVEPPTPENIHLYRAAILTWRKAEIEERSRHADIKLANPHVAEHAAALAVHELARERKRAESNRRTLDGRPKCEGGSKKPGAHAL